MEMDAHTPIMDDYDNLSDWVVAWNHYRARNRDYVPNVARLNLEKRELQRINLSQANLEGADFYCSNLIDATLIHANLREANLASTELIGVTFFGAKLANAKLTDANLGYTDFSNADLSGANLTNALCDNTTFSNVDLSGIRGLATVIHSGPSSLSTSTLVLSRGAIPEEFLRGCGLSPWEVLSARLHDPTLSPADFAEIQQKVYDERMKGYFLRGIFISYSRIDEAFVDVLYKRLKADGANVWLDSQHAVAGSLEKQVQRAIRLNDIVVLVLSEASVQSDWVEAELEWARAKEKDTGRDVLCPIALDDSWKDKAEGSVLWRKVKDKNVLDFSKWRAGGFDPPFQKLVSGMKTWY